MADLKEGKVIIREADMRSDLLRGAKEAYDAVAVSYGPKGKNAVLEKTFGRPMYTRDGITILRDTFFSDRSINVGAQALIEASDSSNRVAGDGSTAVAVLAYHLLDNGAKAIAAGVHPMDVSDTINKDTHVLLDRLKELVIPVKDDQLKEVATVSAGDPLIGQLIAEAILYVGPDGGILTEKAPITEIEREYIDGYYLQSGFTALQAGKKEIVDPYVVVSSKRLSSAADAIEILNGIMRAKNLQPGQVPRVLFVGNIEDAAYNTIVNTINQGQIDAIILKTPPMYGELGKLLLEDIAIYAGCDPITENTNIKQFTKLVKNPANGQVETHSNYIGSVDKVVANRHEATVFASNETEAVQTRIAEIKDQLETEVVDAVAEKLRDRVAKLEGKICLFKIGAPTDSTKEELEFRIEDAINSTRHAYAEGIVAGGGVTLLELSKLDGLSDISRKALQATFQQLLVNANLPSELKLKEALEAPAGHGFNLRKGDELVDMVKEGVIDPYVVARETILHATNVAAENLKVGVGIVFENTPKE